MHIATVDVAHCPVPLPRPLVLGDITIRTRDFVALRIRTDAGIEGYALGYPRGTPLAPALHTLAGRLIGADPLMRRAITHGIERGNAPGALGLVRATSLIDIALWDIAAKAAGQPLYRLLGGYRTRIPAMAVAGYFAEARTPDDIGAEVASLAGEGFRLVKVILPAADPVADRVFLEALLRSVPGGTRLAVEAHWSWTTLDDALHACRLIDDLGLAFIEDPFAAQQWRLTGELGTKLRTPLAAGEDNTGLLHVAELLAQVAILRLDATSSGGITGFCAGAALAAAAGRRVFPHIWTGLHGQLAAALPQIAYVETIPSATGADPVGRLLEHEPAIAEGYCTPDETPGAGLALDWTQVVALSAHSSSQ